MAQHVLRFRPSLPALTRRLLARHASGGAPGSGPDPGAKASPGGASSAEARCPPGFDPPRVQIPARETSEEAEACAEIVGRGLRLARQERWRALEEALNEADHSSALTPAGTPAARLLCDGAAQDVLMRVAEAMARGDAEAVRCALQGHSEALGPTTEAPMRALLAAWPQIGAARLWRAGSTPLSAAARGHAVRHHLEMAHLLLRPHDPVELGSAALQAARCAVLEVLPTPSEHLARSYETLIALQPACPDHLRAYGHDLSPRRFGTWPGLDRTARRLAMSTAGSWGTGGYCWVWLDVLAAQPEGWAHVDAELFVAGLHDLLQPQPPETWPDQHRANLLAARCAELAPLAEHGAAARIAGSLDWIVEDHLRELHPQLWAPPSPDLSAPDEAARREAGCARAHSVLNTHFVHQLSRGRSVIFTDQGLALQPSGCASCTLAPCAALAYPRRNLRDEDPPCLT
ncbi:hypothetical protein LCM08_02070 [Salipiger pacificus]|nr:hypothetical protein [Alloyangia pacifica]MCA0943691.1 hypothetical protein [Alloyangia pacifica]